MKAEHVRAFTSNVSVKQAFKAVGYLEKKTSLKCTLQTDGSAFVSVPGHSLRHFRFVQNLCYDLG